MKFNRLVEQILDDPKIYFFDLPSRFIIETFEFIRRKDNTFYYFLKTRKGITYTANVSVISQTKIVNDIAVKKMYTGYKNDPETLRLYGEMHDLFKQQTGDVVFVEFNRQGEHLLTNDMAEAAFEVFVSLKNSILDAVHKSGSKNIFCIMFRTDKSEHDKRIRLYRKIIQKAFPNKYQNIMVDGVTEKNYNVVYLY